MCPEFHTDGTPYVDAGRGGCWFCSRKDDALVLCWQFDTYVHKACALKAYNEDVAAGDIEREGSTEASIIYDEVKDY